MFYGNQFIWKLVTPKQTNATIFQLFPAIKELSNKHRLVSSQNRSPGTPTRRHIEYTHTYSRCYRNARYSIKANRTSMGISRASKIITPWTVDVEWKWGMKKGEGGGKRSRSQCLRTWTNLHNDRELPAMESLSLSVPLLQVAAMGDTTPARLNDASGTNDWQSVACGCCHSIQAQQLLQ